MKKKNAKIIAVALANNTPRVFFTPPKPLPVIKAENSTSGEIISNYCGGKVMISAAVVSAEGKTADSLPTFSLEAYNGGPMRLEGFQHPVVIDASGVTFAHENMPIYVGHLDPKAPNSEMMETLVGQGKCVVSNGKITATGTVTSSSKTVQSMVDHAKKGFKFQNSVHGRPTEMNFIRAGESTTVNGKTVNGPAIVARKSIIDHIAILPLGADTSTKANIAAQHAVKETAMEKFAWIKAKYGFDQAAFDALPAEAKKSISAAFDASATPAKKDEPAATQTIAATGSVTDTDALIKAQNAAIGANQTRIGSIMAIDGAAGFPAITAQAVTENWSVEKAENAVIKAQRNELTKNSSLGGFGANTNNAARQKAYAPKVIEAATLLSCGYPKDRLEKDQQYGADILNLTDDFSRMERSRVMTPSKIARICARMAGVANLPDGHGSDFWSEALANDRICPRGGERIMAGYAPINAEFSTISLPVALSNVMNKFVLMGYMSVDPNACDPKSGIQAWKNIAKVSSVNDFKPNFRLRLVANVLLKKLTNGGEIQHGTVGEQSYSILADTKAIILGLTRKDLINDDQSVLSTLPTHFGVGSGRTVANDIWDCWLAGIQSDGVTAFYTATDITTLGNAMKSNATTGVPLNFSNAEAANTRLAAQTDPTGQPAGLAGEILLVPTALSGIAMQINKSERMPVYATTRAGAVGDYNTMFGKNIPVSSAYLQSGTIKPDGTLRTGSATDYYSTTSSSNTVYPIEVGFLNGVEVPIIERAEADFNRLGISFRTFLDYGISMGEPRAVQKQSA